MKTVLELLGHSDECGPDCCCNNLDEPTRTVLACVAQRAREEMREAALDAIANTWSTCRRCGNEGSCDRCQGLAIAEMEIRKLPVTP